jgi:hypothetical protein
MMDKVQVCIELVINKPAEADSCDEYIIGTALMSKTQKRSMKVIPDKKDFYSKTMKNKILTLYFSFKKEDAQRIKK